ncbi:MAG: adenylosuccinate lyase [Endomicrobiales bacterium]|nr:adenylosuccinate lyase [Endomicrobiales bacterium]
MIPRYTRDEMAQIWSDDNKFRIMLAVEILAAEAMAKIGKIPRKAIDDIIRKSKINVKRIQAIEETVKHDIIAFLTQIGERVGPSAKYLHLGMTSSDVLDTALAVQMMQSCKLLERDLEDLAKTIKKLAMKYKDTPMIGRTHGVHAEPITFGLKMASFYSEIMRAIELIQVTVKGISYGKVSGAVGTFAHLDPKVEEYVCKKLGLKPEPVSTQIVPRDRHAAYLCRLAIIGSSLERFAVEIRHLQKTEVREVEEPFTKGQKGSSAMPHKRNPILSENICGLARVLKGYAMTSLENVALWHERDISHSSAERIIMPDASIALDFMVVRMNKLLSGLAVYPENMKANLDKTKDGIFSGALLLSLVGKGLQREKAYEYVQKTAFEARKKGVNMETAALSNKNISKHLSSGEIKKAFSIKSHLAKTDFIFKRVFSY